MDGSLHSSNGGSGRSGGSSGGRKAAAEAAELLKLPGQHGMGALPEDSDIIGAAQASILPIPKLQCCDAS